MAPRPLPRHLLAAAFSAALVACPLSLPAAHSPDIGAAGAPPAKSAMCLILRGGFRIGYCP